MFKAENFGAGGRQTQDERQRGSGKQGKKTYLRKPKVEEKGTD